MERSAAERADHHHRHGHVLLVPYPSQGHINPMLQFGKRLASYGLLVTIAITRSIAKSTLPAASATSVAVEHISDGYDEDGFSGAESIEVYLKRFEAAGSRTLLELIESLCRRGRPVDAVVCDSFLSWALAPAKGLGIVVASFFTQSCAVNAVYYHAYHGLLALPPPGPTVSLDGLPELALTDVPSLVADVGPYQAYTELVVNQYSNLDRADVVFLNTFYRLEAKVADWLATKYQLPFKTIGPTVPSLYLDQRLEGDRHYGFDLCTPTEGPSIIEWLESQETAGSVVYVAFGSMATLSPEQMEELAWGLKGSGKNFLWVVRGSEEGKLPTGFEAETAGPGLVVRWCPQLEVLAHPAVGCFVTHCGWNSTLEGLSLGVPMVGVPQWTDQPTNAKYLADVWGAGVRARAADGSGVVGREELERCVREVMEGERGAELRRNAAKWRELAKEAVGEGGSSDVSIREFVAKIVDLSV